MTKLIKRVKDYSERKRSKKLGLTILLERGMRGDLIGAFKRINGISDCGRHFFNISSPTGNLMSSQITKTKLLPKRILPSWLGL